MCLSVSGYYSFSRCRSSPREQDSVQGDLPRQKPYDRSGLHAMETQCLGSCAQGAHCGASKSGPPPAQALALFLLTAIFIVRDKLACELAVSGTSFDHCLLSPSSSSVLLKFISWCKKVPPTGCRGKVNFEKSTSEPSFDLHRH